MDKNNFLLNSSTNILVSLLTSNGIEFLSESIRCFENQKDVNLDEFKLVIVVNTLNDEYYKLVLDRFSYKYDIIRTESNGKPGKGHNSVIDIFKSDPRFKYLIPIDGDDFLYPYALKRFKIYMDYNPDVLMIGFNDMLGKTYPEHSLSVPIGDKLYLYFNNCVNDMQGIWADQKPSPFKNSIEKCNTPGRLLLISRKALKMNLKFDENLKWFDDFIVFLQCLENNILNPHVFKIFMVDDKDIYLYNRINENSVTDSFALDYDNNVKSERKSFNKSIRNKFLSIRNWPINKMIFLELESDASFNVVDKYNFVKDLILNSEITKILNTINIRLDNINHFRKYAVENKLDKLYEVYKDFK